MDKYGLKLLWIIMGKYRSQKFTEEKKCPKTWQQFRSSGAMGNHRHWSGWISCPHSNQSCSKNTSNLWCPWQVDSNGWLKYSWIFLHSCIQSHYIYIYHIYIQLIYIALHSQQFTYIDLPHFAQILDNVVGFCRSAFFRCFPGECHGVASDIGTYNVLKY